MIVREFYTQRSDGVNLFKTYSDEGFLINKVGTTEIYQEAIDVENAPFTYEETTLKVETEEENEKEINNEDILSNEEFLNMLEEELL
jgi:hypothetical protein